MAEINMALIEDRESLHEALAEALGLPEYYGRNLDALYDCLTEYGGELTIQNFNLAPEQLGSYAGPLEEVLRAAESDNPNFTFIAE